MPEVCRAEHRCGRASVAGNVSQRGCVYNGARVVLNPITDALHLVHGPIGCAAYTWDIRGSLSSGPETYRLGFSTDMQEEDVIFGGEKKLSGALHELIARYRPPAVFVYATCIVGIIGDDLKAVARRVTAETGCPVIPVQSEGFRGTKAAGYRAACDALLELMAGEAGGGKAPGPVPRGAAGHGYRGHARARSVNILGEFNVAGEAWTIRSYLEELGIAVTSVLTGDARVAEIRRAPRAALNVVQCAGSMTYLAEAMRERFAIPYRKVSFFGPEDTASALMEIAGYFDDADLTAGAAALVAREQAALERELQGYRGALRGRKAAVYMGGAFKSISLIKAFHYLGMEVVLVGSQVGKAEEYRAMRDLLPPEAVILDDAGAPELARLLSRSGADILVGGVKERPLAYKLGIGFCDFNHERKIPFAGFQGFLNFTREVYASLTSPVWCYLRPGAGGDQGVCCQAGDH